MREFCALCMCGEMAVPLITDDEMYMSLVKEAYCPNCIELKHPGVNFLASGYLLFDLNVVMDENTILHLDQKTIGMYSIDFNGFFGVRFSALSTEAIEVCKFRTPFSANVERVPLCFRRCHEVKFGGMSEKDGSWYPEMKCRIYNKDIQETITFKCDHYKAL